MQEKSVDSVSSASRRIRDFSRQRKKKKKKKKLVLDPETAAAYAQKATSE